jgi:hypothetical protein
VRGGVSQHVAMAISGHRTEAVFRRYDITTDDDLASAAERVTSYVATLPDEAKVSPLPEQNKHNSVIVGESAVA